MPTPAYYEINQGFTFLDNVSANYGLSSTHVGSTPASFSISYFPISGLSAVQATEIGFVAGVASYFGSISASETLPYTMLNNLALSSAAITIAFDYDNTRYHADDENETFTIYLCTYTDSTYLSAGTDETIAAGSSGQQYATYGPYTLMAYGDAGAPSAAPTGFTATAGDRLVNLTWTAAAIQDLSATQIRRSLSLITETSGGDLVYSGLLSSYTDNVPNEYTNGFVYYAAYAIDNVGEASTIVSVSADPTWGNWETFTQQQRMRVLGYI